MLRARGFMDIDSKFGIFGALTAFLRHVLQVSHAEGQILLVIILRAILNSGMLV